MFTYYTAANPICSRLGGNITALVPNYADHTGGSLITVFGTTMSSADVLTVTVNGVSAAILTQNVNQLTFLTPEMPFAMKGEIVVISQCAGVSTTNQFTYCNQTGGSILSVNPTYGPNLGNSIVTIVGLLGTGDDIHTVTLGDVAATIIWQNATTVIVSTGYAGVGIPGATVRIIGYCRGVTSRANAWTYQNCAFPFSAR
jgi:hypothetical protein